MNEDVNSSVTLSAFQAGAGVPLNSQLLMVNNPLLEADFFHVLTDEPRKWRIPIGELRNVLHRFRLFLRDLRFNFVRPDHGLVLRVCDADGRLERIRVLQAVVDGLSDRLNGRTLLLGKTDIELDDELMRCFRQLQVHVFGNSLNTEDARAHYFPMGRDFRGYAEHGLSPSVEKDSLVYCNFSVNTHPVRAQVLDALQSKAFVCFKHMGDFLNYELSHADFYRELSRAKFSIAPRGNGIETFRMWDSLYLGTVPIVVSEAYFHQQLLDLPILFLPDYEALRKLEAEELESIYQGMLERKWNYRKLYIEYWLEQVHRSY